MGCFRDSPFARGIPVVRGEEHSHPGNPWNHRVECSKERGLNETADYTELLCDVRCPRFAVPPPRQLTHNVGAQAKTVIESVRLIQAQISDLKQRQENQGKYNSPATSPEIEDYGIHTPPFSGDRTAIL